MSELKATHQCTICGARWRQLDDFRWNLRSKECGPCCDYVPMGDQIEALEDVALWSGPLTAEEQGMIDDAWQTHKAATPPPVSADALGEVETIAIAMWQAESVRCSGRRRLIEWHEEHGTTQDSWRDLATAALSAMSPAGEVEKIVAWLRKQGGQLLRTGSSADKIAGAELLMKADAIERGDYRHD